MLRQRVITAVILMAGLLAALVWLPPIGFDLLLLLVVLAGAWEWTTLSGTSLVPLRIGFQSVLLLSWCWACSSLCHDRPFQVEPMNIGWMTW
jgi:phosphatidate cytidylyltransferase